MFKAKMFITYVFVSISVISVVFGARLVNQSKMNLVYEDVDVQKKEEQVTATVEIEQSDNTTDASDSNRSSNLKYVDIIQKSSMWGEIKKKILAIKTEVDGKMIEKQPETLSNKELEQLSLACYVGLKCVAIDQLIVLKAVKQPSNNGGMTTLVFTAMSKICKAITKFSTEYHEDTNQYPGVTECDDKSKVYQLVTKIIEENQALCRIDESSKTNGTKTNDPKTIVDNPNTSNNDIIRNYSTVNNYNVNKDTVNLANINIIPSSDEAPKKSVSKPVASNARESSKNVNQANTVQVDDNSSSANQDMSNELISNIGSQNSDPTHSTSNTKSNKDDKNNGQHKNTNKNSSEDSEKRVNSEVGASSDTQESTNNNDRVKNSVSISNPGGLGKSHADTDIASSGSSNQHNIKKGTIQNGYINNGNLKVYNQNHGVITKGDITNSNAENGTISIGTINEGPVNCSTTNDSSNGKKVNVFNKQNIEQFSTTIDNIYSAMLEKLSKK